MKKILIVILIIILAGLIFGEKLGTLDKVLQPGSMVVGGDRIYIGEGCSFYVYSRRNLELLFQFGRKGEGPGELKYLPILPNILTARGDKIYVEGYEKIISFTAQGKYIKENRKQVRGMRLIPLGDKFIGIILRVRGGKPYNVLTLVDANWKVLKELHEQPFPQQPRNAGKTPVVMVPDSIHFDIFKDKIYVEKSDRGFVIGIYDLQGNKMNTIRKNIPKNMIESRDKAVLLAEFKRDKEVQRQTNVAGGWELFEKRLKLIYPQFFPAIQNIMVRDGKIYVQTFERNGDREKYHILDLKGRDLGNAYLPVPVKTPFIARMVGAEVNFYDIADRTFYYLVENEDNEEWEIHSETIK